jgi:hypothetical protein
MCILKINFKVNKIVLTYFQVKIILKHNFYHTLKYTSYLISTTCKNILDLRRHVRILKIPSNTLILVDKKILIEH